MSTQLKEQLRDSLAVLSGGMVSIDGKPINTSGIIPLDHRLLVLHDVVSDKFEGTSLIRPDAERDKQKHAQTKATVIACGDMCWAEARYDAQRFGVDAIFPEPGSRVLVGRYTGDTHKGADGQDYTVLNDSDVIAFLDKSEG
jgi:co-chaperonin GroES (HSP10)